MTEYPKFEFSNKDATRAGKVIAERRLFTAETEQEIRHAFKIANNWRDAHALPMRSIRQSIIYHMGANSASGITGARLKRMPAIIGKLRRKRLNLNQMQDLAGCRAIMESMDGVDTIAKTLREASRHEVHKIDDYLATPKPDGYRSCHVILKFNHEDDSNSAYHGKRVEVQIRSRLQHAWATSVEAVGLFRSEGLKNHEGSDDWLRLFCLMSGEFAEVENCPAPPGCEISSERRAEIRWLAAKINAVDVLDTINQGVLGSSLPTDPYSRPSHFLITFDKADKSVKVEAKFQPLSATNSYDAAERDAAESTNIVLVEVEKIETLKAAYPNYFGDVKTFTGYLKHVAQGQSAVDYARAVTQSRPPARSFLGDLSWLRRSPFKRPDNVGKRRS